MLLLGSILICLSIHESKLFTNVLFLNILADKGSFSSKLRAPFIFSLIMATFEIKTLNLPHGFMLLLSPKQAGGLALFPYHSKSSQ